MPTAQVVSQSLTRKEPSQASTAKPKRRRKGFTPRSTSSPAHSARAAGARTTRTAGTQPWGCPSHITADASNHTASSQLGSWASVIRPVVRLRNIQLTNPERFPVSPGALKIAFLRVDARPRRSPDRMAPAVDYDSPCPGVRHGRFVAVPGEVRHDVAFFFRRLRVVGSLGRPVAAFLRQGRVRLCLDARVVLQHVRDRLPRGIEGDGACIAGSAFVPQLYESVMDVPVLLAGRVGDVVLGPVVVVSHIRTSLRVARRSCGQTSLLLSRRAQVPATSMRSATPSIRVNRLSYRAIRRS